MTDREAFEAWDREIFALPDRYYAPLYEGDFPSIDVKARWKAWNAATAAERDRNQFDKRRTADDFTIVVANALHFFDAAEKTSHPIGSYSEILDSHKGSIERYRNDAIFHAKVTSIVAQLLRVLYEPDLSDKIRSGE